MNFSRQFFSNQYPKENKPIAFLEKCMDKNSPLIQQVLRNNSYLLRKNNVSATQQIKSLRVRGVKISAAGISRYNTGKFKTCSLTYLQIFAQYWGLNLSDMMTRDFVTDDSKS